MNRNIFSLVFNKARNMLVVAPEIAKGAHKSSRRKKPATSRPALVLQFVFAAGAFACMTSVGHAQTLPAGSILDINNSGTGETSYATANSWQNYSVTFTAGSTGDDYLLFAFRQDPGFWTFGNISLELDGTSTNLLTDPTLTQGGTVSGQSGLQAPADWGIVYQTGVTPSYAGYWEAPNSGGASTTNVGEGTAGSWYDGAVGSFDGIYQGIDLTAGDQYTVTFTALSTDPASTSNGVELGVFVGPCATLTGPAANCTPQSTSGFTASATPAQTVNAGSTATNITSTDNASGLASSPATLLPVLDGGTLVLDGTDLTPYTFSITGNNGTVDLAGQSATISNPISDNTAGTPGSLTIANSGSGGALTLTGVNTYTGSTTINAGAELDLSGAGSIASSSGLTDNGTFDISNANGNESIANLAGNGTVTLGGNGLTITNGNGSTFAGSINGSGSVTMAGGAQALSGTNTYTGGTYLDGGTLQVSGDANLGNASGALNFNGGALENTASFTTSRNINVAGNAVFNTDAGTTLTDTTGTITGTGSIEKEGAGALILGADNATGGILVGAGLLELTGASAATGDVSVDSGASLTLVGNGSISHASNVIIDGTLDISGANNSQSITGLAGNGTVNLGGNSLTFSNADDSYGGTINGVGGVIMNGGVQALTGTNTYTGGTTLNGGALQVGSDANLGDASGALNFNGGTLESTASFTSARNIAMTGAANFDVDGGTTLTDTAGSITGNGPINKEGAGTLVLGADNSTGGVNVGAGALQLTGVSTDTGVMNITGGTTLALTGNGSIASASDVIDNGTFDISGANGAASITGLQGGGTVNLGNNGLALTNANDIYTGTITGNGGVAMNGGVEALTGTNTYTGGTTLNGGLLQVSSDANLGNASGALNFNGGALETTATFTSTRTITTNGVGADFDVDDGTTLTDTAGTITGTGPIYKAGAGTLILGTDNGSGGVNVGTGTLQLTGASTDTGIVGIQNGATLALTGNGSIANASDVQNNGTFDISGANGSQSITGLQGSGTATLGNNGLTLTNADDIYSGRITGNGGVTMSGGVEALSGANTYTGGTTLNGGALQVSSDANLGDASGALNFNGGTLETTATFTTTRNIAMTGAANFDVDGGTTLTDTAGSITGNGPITKTGLGTLVLGTDNSSGGVIVGGGTLQLTGASTDTGTVGVMNGATLALTGNGSIANASDVQNVGTFDISGANDSQSITGLAGSGTVNLGNNGLTLTNANDIYSGAITGNGGVTLNNGVEELSGTNTYTGGTTLNGGNLMVSSDANLGDASGALNFNGGALESTASFTSTRNINAATGINIDTDAGTTLTDTAGAVTGTGPINKGGTGTLVLGADNSTGGVNVGAGTLQLTGVSTDTGATNINTGATVAITGNGSDASASSINNSGTFDISGANTSQSITSLAGNGTVALGNNGLALTNASGIYSGAIGGNGGVSLNGGAEELSGTNTYTGGTTLNGGTLAVSSDANLGDASGALNFNGGTLENTASFTTTRNINATGAVNIDTDAGTTLTDTAGAITGSGPITKGGTGTLVLGADDSTGGLNVGAGTLQLTGASTDSGATNVASDATLAITGNGSDANASSINNSGTLDISGANGSQSVGSLAGNGTVALGNNGLTLTNANGNFSGTIGGHGGVSMSGGTEVLSGANTYTGGTTLDGGNLVVSSDANLGAAGTPVTFNGGSLTVTQSMNTSRNLVIQSGGADFNTLTGVTVQDSGDISGTGGLVKTGNGTLIVSGSNTFSGGTLIDGGVVQIDNGSSLGTGTILLSGGTLQTTASLNNNQNVVASGNVGVNVNAGTSTLMAGNIQQTSGSGCFVKSGSGTLDFTGNEVLSGGTCVQEGMLRANGSLVSNVSVYTQGELRGVGVITGPIQVDGRLAPGNSPGTLTVTGSVTMNAGSTYEEDIDGLGTGTGKGNYSRLIITGANSQFIANGTLMPLLRGITGNASNTYTPQIGDVYQFVLAQGGIVGQFSALTQPTGLAPDTRMVAFYNVDNNHSIELGVVPDSYASLIAGSNANRNALNLAGALDAALNLQAAGTASSGQSQLLFALADAKATQLGGVMTNLSGEIYADEAAAARATGLAMQSDTLGHLTTDDSDVTGQQSAHQAWANVTHDGNRWSADAQGSGFQTGTNQTTAGVDIFAQNGTVLGVAASNHDTDVNADSQQGTIRGNDGIVYGQQAIASVLVDGMVASGHDTWITRRPDPTGVSGNLYARSGGSNTMADVTARMPMSVGSMHVEPYASLTWQQFDRGGMSEGTDSPAALQVARLSAAGTRALVGVNLGSMQQDPLLSEVTYRFGAAVGEDSRGLLSPAVQATIEDESFMTKAPQIGRGFAQFQANGTLRLSHATYLYGGLTDEVGARRGSYGVTAGVRVSF
ncbi:hypothetical protein DWU98_09045 [Dyella monticola]|uniref:Autotransporter domain-containing protein n=1 Tax=Dyella monticola TaxID=1927958 RepID=A0A370X1Q4_9GAMM|nr:autotransporter-associated beta strand repeat-containing protein [Dyella monticola]RDS82181.1 hypothetical protein DWU98_09045 [Dyella monticola]